MTTSMGCRDTGFWGAGVCGPQLEIRCQEDGDGALRATLIGELDLAVADPLQARLAQLMQGERPVRLDLSQLQFIDCAGIGGILAVLSEARRRHSQLEVDPIVSPSVGRIMALGEITSALWPGGARGAGAPPPAGCAPMV